MDTYDIPKKKAVLSEVLRCVCENDWFKRIWVVQETLLSNAADLVLGKTTIPWETTFRAATSFVNHASTCCLVDQVDSVEQIDAHWIHNNMKVVTRVLLSFQRIPLGTKNELLANLWMFHNRLSTLASDKVHGILGLLQFADIAIEPNYEKTFFDLCRAVALEDIRVSGNLNALKDVRTEAEGLASWSTDWSSLDYWAEDQSRILTELYKPIYSASGQFGAYAAIRLGGRIVDRVTHTTKRLSFPFHKIGSEYLKALEDVLNILQVLKATSGGGSAFSAFWRTLLGGHILPYRERQDLFHSIRSSGEHTYEPTIRRARPADCMAFLLWWLVGADGHYLDKQIGAKTIWLKNHTPSEISGTYDVVVGGAKSSVEVHWAATQLKKLTAVRNINASIARATSGRCMFVTASGYIGLGSEHTNSGDQVAILLGGSTPFMLREVGKRKNPPRPRWMKPAKQQTTTLETFYSLLGDCYVHGCMDGEQVKDVDVGKWPSLALI